MIYITQYNGDSQGIYVRPSNPSSGYSGIEHPFDLEGRTVGVPFGSTVHYQLLFVIDMAGLAGSVNVVDMSPNEIMKAWTQNTSTTPGLYTGRRSIDAAGCWGTARTFILGAGAETLVSAGVVGDWGRPTFVDVAVRRSFAEKHVDFVTHFVGILSRINDSYDDRLGTNDRANVQRWDIKLPAGISLLPSMVDALMVPGQPPHDPSESQLLQERRNLDGYSQPIDQTSCEYLGAGPMTCVEPTKQHKEIYQTAQFLVEQKFLSTLGPIEHFRKNQAFYYIKTSDILDGSFLAFSRRACKSCLHLGPYK